MALPPTLLSCLVSSLASLTTWATSISFFMEAGSLLFFPDNMAFRSPRAFPSFFKAFSANALPAFFYLDLAFFKATSKSACVEVTIFLAVLQAFNTFSKVFSLSGSQSHFQVCLCGSNHIPGCLASLQYLFQSIQLVWVSLILVAFVLGFAFSKAFALPLALSRAFAPGMIITFLGFSKPLGCSKPFAFMAFMAFFGAMFVSLRLCSSLAQKIGKELDACSEAPKPAEPGAASSEAPKPAEPAAPAAAPATTPSPPTAADTPAATPPATTPAGATPAAATPAKEEAPAPAAPEPAKSSEVAAAKKSRANPPEKESSESESESSSSEEQDDNDDEDKAKKDDSKEKKERPPPTASKSPSKEDKEMLKRFRRLEDFMVVQVLENERIRQEAAATAAAAYAPAASAGYYWPQWQGYYPAPAASAGPATAAEAPAAKQERADRSGSAHCDLELADEEDLAADGHWRRLSPAEPVFALLFSVAEAISMQAEEDVLKKWLRILFTIDLEFFAIPTGEMRYWKAVNLREKAVEVGQSVRLS
eukprot:s4858_g1.t1